MASTRKEKPASIKLDRDIKNKVKSKIVLWDAFLKDISDALWSIFLEDVDLQERVKKRIRDNNANKNNTK